MQINRSKFLSISFLLFFILTPSAFSKIFSNQFIEFELPTAWNCTLEGSEWVCQNTLDAKKKDAIIILAAKLKGTQDSLDQYESYLKAPKEYKSVKGRPMKSQPKYSKQLNIQDQVWVDSLHLESEVPGFYTRYLATVKQDIAVLVTYSIDKAKYVEYDKEFETMVKTLKVFRRPGIGLNAKSKEADIFKVNVPTGVNPSAVFPVQTAENDGAAAKKKKATGSSDDDDLMFILAVGVAVVAYIVWRRRSGGV